MTETEVTMCDALEASPLDAGGQLACFLRPHPGDPWHYDNRGLGVWFRSIPGGVDARVGLTRHPAVAPPTPGFGPNGYPEEHPSNADRHALPVQWTEPLGTLNVDALRTLAPAVRSGLIDAIRASVTQHRTARGEVIVPEDTYELVRRTTAAQEVLTQWAQAFTRAAAECTAVLEEEALTAVGGMPGYEEAPSGSLFVPDGEGKRIAVTPDWKPGDSTWDVDTLTAWVAEQTVADEARKPIEVPPGDDPLDVPVWTNAEAVSLIRDGIDRLLRFGKFTPLASKVDAERKRLAGLQRDGDAAVLRQVRSVGLRQYKGVKVTREEAK
jgi:hypothetical protein